MKKEQKIQSSKTVKTEQSAFLLGYQTASGEK
jgi:hypothetical protein